MAQHITARRKVYAEELQEGMVLLTEPGRPAVTRVRTTKKGNIEAYCGKASPVSYPPHKSVWVA